MQLHSAALASMKGEGAVVDGLQKVQNDRRRCKKCQMAAAAAEQRLFAAAGKCSSMLLQESELGQLRNAEKCSEIQRSAEKYREIPVFSRVRPLPLSM